MLSCIFASPDALEVMLVTHSLTCGEVCHVTINEVPPHIMFTVGTSMHCKAVCSLNCLTKQGRPVNLQESKGFFCDLYLQIFSDH